MRVTFILPQVMLTPVGGFLVVYRYANELSARGHDVAVVHPRRLGTERDGGFRAATWPIRKRWKYGRRLPWFVLDDGVRAVYTTDLRERNIPLGDIIFATACTTAPLVAEYAASRGRKFYLIQHYEDFLCGKDGVDATWRLPMQKVVVSRWLMDIARDMGEEHRTTHIPNGVETDFFYPAVRPDDRVPVRVGFLVHHEPSKGTNYAVDAVTEVRDSVPDLEVTAFGARPRPPQLPEWIDYLENASRAGIAAYYNSLAIFLHSSITEGWGLTCAEAMASGCALVASDSGGVRDYAVDGVTAAVVPPGDPSALAARVRDLVADSAMRVALANAGAAAIREFTWQRAADRLEQLIGSAAS